VKAKPKATHLIKISDKATCEVLPTKIRTAGKGRVVVRKETYRIVKKYSTDSAVADFVALNTREGNQPGANKHAASRNHGDADASFFQKYKGFVAGK
jgi:hypothetical protein